MARKSGDHIALNFVESLMKGSAIAASGLVQSDNTDWPPERCNSPDLCLRKTVRIYQVHSLTQG